MCSLKSLLILFIICFTHLKAIENVDYDYDYDKTHKSDDKTPDDSPLELPTDLELIDVEHPTNITENIRDLHQELPDNFDQVENATQLAILEKLLQNPIVNETVFKLRQKFSNFTRNVKWNLQSFITESKGGLSENSRLQLRNTLVAFIDSLELSPLCLMSFVMMKRGLAQKELWPLKFMDSMDLSPSGMLEGKYTSFGEYDECLGIENDQFKGLKMKGQYCLAKFPAFYLKPVLKREGQNETEMDQFQRKILKKIDVHPNLLKLVQAINYFDATYYRFGICIPSTCSSKEINRALNKIMSPDQKQFIEIERECKVKNVEPKKNGYQRTAQSIIMTLVILVLISTSVELYFNIKRKDFGRKKVIKKSLLVFSAISNTKLLFKKDNNRLKVVDTIFLLFITVEFLGRSYIQPVFYNFIGILRVNKGITKQYFSARKFFFLRNSSYSMTIYILLSSIVLAYKLSGEKRKGKYNPILYFKYLVNRYLSLFRRIIGPLLLIYLLPLWTDGPIWHYLEPIHAKPCKQNLLASLFFYNNYMPGFKEICNLPSATFSAIFQLQVFAPLVLLLINFKIFGYITLVLIVLLGCFLSISRRLFQNFLIAPWEVSGMNSIPEISHSFFYYLGSTEQNISTFIIGLIVGYLIRKKPIIKSLGKNMNLFVWAVFLSLPQIASYWSESFKAIKGDFSPVVFLIWFASGRVMWALGYGWLVYACSTNRGGIINRILSAEALQPLARLAFGIYLNHINIISIRLFAIKQTYLLTHSVIFENVFIDYLIAILVSYIFFILIESPVYHLIKIICGQTVDEVIKTDDYEDNNGDTVRDYEENIEIKLFSDPTTATHEL